MIQEHDKIKAITHEVMSYFLENKMYDFKIHVEIADHILNIEICAPTEKVPDSFEELIEQLNVPRDYEIGDYYFGLMTSADHQSNNYTLLGRSIDEVHSSYEDGILHLKLQRNLRT